MQPQAGKTHSRRFAADMLRIPPGLMAASACLALVGCLSAPDRSFFVKRNVYLPAAGGKAAVQQVKEIRHLLQASSAGAARNRHAMKLALAGDWRNAGRIWQGLARGDDCRILNNLGVARDMEGRNSLAINRLARAYELCADDDRIRWNYRSVLGTRAPSVTRYRILDEGGGSGPAPVIGPAAQKLKRDREARIRREEAARKAREQEKARAAAKRRAEEKKRAATRRRLEEARRRAENKRREEARRLAEEKRRAAERKRREDERKRQEAERKRKEAERKREPNTYFEP